VKTWITSDLHFGHINIMKYCHLSRGHFTDIDHMNESLVNTINAMVMPNDVLIILGDIAFCSPQKAIDYLKRISCKKRIVWGNHDKKLRNSNEYVAYRKTGDIISDGDYLELTHKVQEKNYKLVMSHFPFRSWNGAGGGSIQLHGHVHSTESNKLTPGMRQLDIGVDGNGLFPYDIDLICLMMDDINPRDERDGREGRS
jgi:calcineurin-like phosphoesterase family protein